MTTAQTLRLIFGNTHIPLEKARTEWLPHISQRKCRELAQRQSLPWPVFRPVESQKAEYLVNVNDIADWLDKKQAEAQDDWKKMNG